MGNGIRIRFGIRPVKVRDWIGLWLGQRAKVNTR